MADSDDNKHVEVSEVQEFSGGQIKTVEPMAEGDTEHGVHGNYHHYSGGEIVERGDTVISPWMWGFFGIVIVVIIGVLLTGNFIPGVRMMRGTQYGAPALVKPSAYNNLEGIMKQQQSFVALTSPNYIDMYELPRPGGQSLTQAVTAGTDVYTTYCIGCHGPNQDGNGPNSVSLDPKPRNLRNADFMQAMSYQRIWTSIHKGVPGTAMPRWENTLNDKQIQDVICYVFSLSAPTDPKSGSFIHIPAQDIAGSAPASQPGMGATYQVR